MPTKYSMLETYVSRHEYRKEVWRELQDVRVRIAKHDEDLKRITQLKLKDEEQLKMAERYFECVSRDMKELQDKLCKEDGE